MSNELISRKSLMKKFLVNRKVERIPDVDCDNFPVMVSIKEIKDTIRNEPTAYDVDKVVERLETDEKHTFDGCINKRYAIEIVKSGLNVGGRKAERK